MLSFLVAHVREAPIRYLEMKSQQHRFRFVFRDDYL